MKIGQKVWIENTERDTYRKGKVRKSEIRKIGRKYIYTYNARFYIDTLRGDAGEYTSNSRLWLSEQDFNNNQELEKNFRLLRRKFDSYTPNITLDQSRAILAILGPKQECSYDDFLIEDNYTCLEHAADFKSAQEIAMNWIADEDFDRSDYTVDIYKKIKSYDKESKNNE